MTTTLAHVIKDNSNAAFLARFALVILGLHLVVGAFGLIAYQLDVRHPSIDPAQEAALIQERIRPPARVATASAPLADRSRGQQPAFGTAARDAATLVAGSCAGCHAGGVLGAPRIGDAQAWLDRERRAGGVDGLVRSALQGRGPMPPGGGLADLRPEEAREAIALMRRR